MPSIMTLGLQSKQFVLRGRTETLIPDFREINFLCGFHGDAVNGAPKIRVSVGEVGADKPSQIRIEIIPPETGPAGGGGPVISEVLLGAVNQPAAITGAGVAVVTEPVGTLGGPSAAGTAATTGTVADSGTGSTPAGGGGPVISKVLRGAVIQPTAITGVAVVTEPVGTVGGPSAARTATTIGTVADSGTGSTPPGTSALVTQRYPAVRRSTRRR